MADQFLRRRRRDSAVRPPGDGDEHLRHHPIDLPCFQPIRQPRRARRDR
jgi:hypothetical protein